MGCLVQEAVGVKREAAKMFHAVLPIMQHHACTDFGISNKFYGSTAERLGGTGQGNSVSGAICQDTSCLMFKYLEQLNLGVKMQRVEVDKLLIRLAIAFVDDTNFYSNGPLAEHHMQLIMKLYCALHEATGGKLQQSKIVFYF